MPVVLNGAQTINAAAGNIAISRVVSDSGAGFTKAGSRTLTLSGVNTYTGGTTVNAGILEAMTTGSLSG